MVYKSLLWILGPLSLLMAIVGYSTGHYLISLVLLASFLFSTPGIGAHILPKNYNHKFVLILSGFLYFVSILVINNTTTETKKVQVELNKIDMKSKVPSYVIENYTKDQYPAIFKKFKSKINDINALRKKAAFLAANSEKCDEVSLSELNADDSKKNNLQFFVDCKNGSRFRMSESDIISQKSVLTEKEKALDEKEAMEQCMNYIRASATNPDSVDMHAFGGINHFTNETTGNVVVDIEFDAENDFGAKITSTAHCLFPPNNPGEFSIRRN